MATQADILVHFSKECVVTAEIKLLILCILNECLSFLYDCYEISDPFMTDIQILPFLQSNQIYQQSEWSDPVLHRIT